MLRYFRELAAMLCNIIRTTAGPRAETCMHEYPFMTVGYTQKHRQTHKKCCMFNMSFTCYMVIFNCLTVLSKFPMHGTPVE